MRNVIDSLAIGLFSGAGGLSYGLRKAGFDVRSEVEVDPDCVQTLKQNNKHATVIMSDIRKLEPSAILKQTGKGSKKLALIAGGPPCQGFSVSNKRNRDLTNPVNCLYKEFFKFVKDLSPRLFLFENVEGICSIGNGEVFQDIIRTGENLGYSVSHSTLKSECFGVPQKRKRVFFIGSKGASIELPTDNAQKVISVKDAIDDLPKIENGNAIDVLPYSRSSGLSDYQKNMRLNTQETVSNNLVTKNSELVIKRYEYIPEGGNWKNIPAKYMSNYKNLSNCHGWIYYRLKWAEPSVVIGNFRKNMLIHPEQPRGLSVREAARLQSFPDDYIFCGKLGAQQQQIANAVPPLLSEWLGRHLIKEIG